MQQALNFSSVDTVIQYKLKSFFLLKTDFDSDRIPVSLNRDFLCILKYNYVKIGKMTVYLMVLRPKRLIKSFALVLIVALIIVSAAARDSIAASTARDADFYKNHLADDRNLQKKPFLESTTLWKVRKSPC